MKPKQRFPNWDPPIYRRPPTPIPVTKQTKGTQSIARGYGIETYCSQDVIVQVWKLGILKIYILCRTSRTGIFAQLLFPHQLNMQHPDYAVWSFIGFIMVLLPSPWHWRARNIATLSLIFWVAMANLVVFVNSLVWADNFKDTAPVWCDISMCLPRSFLLSID